MKKIMSPVMLVMVGIGIGMAMCAVAARADGKYFLSVDTFRSVSNLGQTGYIVGVHDTLSWLATEPRAQEYASDTVDCMERMENGEAMRLWALRRFASAPAEVTGDDSAIDALMIVKPLHPCGF
jgi:hypothetical protein